MSKMNFGGYDIEENDDGTLTFTRNSDGKTTTIDGDTLDFSKLATDLDGDNQSISNLQSVSTEETNITDDVIRLAPGVENGSQVGTYEDYKISSYNSFEDAFNQAVKDINSLNNPRYVIKLPAIRDVEIDNKLVVKNDYSRTNAGPVIVGPGRTALSLQTSSSFADDKMFEIESAPGSRGMEATIGGFTLRDINGKCSSNVLHIKDSTLTRVYDMLIGSTTASDLLRINQVNKGDDFGILHGLHIRGMGSGQTGIHIDGNQFYEYGTRYNGSSISSGGTGLDPAFTHYVHADFESLDYGIDGLSAGIATVRFEKPSNFDTPITAYDDSVINILQTADSAAIIYRNSIDGSPNTTWNGVPISKLSQGSWSPGGAALTNNINTVGTVNTLNEKIELTDSSGNNLRIDCGGNSPFADFGIGGENAVKIKGQLGRSGTNNRDSRAGLVESEWTDWAGVYVDEAGNEVRIIAKEGGSHVGNSPITQLGKSELIYSVHQNANAEITVSAYQSGSNNGFVGAETFQFSSVLSSPQPVHHTINPNSTTTSHYYNISEQLDRYI